jgi:hypothetical protein
MTKDIPWARVGVEGIVIVGSILLAFGIDAWWDKAQERSEERQVLSALREDFVGNRDLLDAVLETHSTSSQIFRGFEANPEASDTSSLESMEAVLVALYGSRTFEPFQGTLEATISSGKLELIQDPDLRASLAEWVRATTDVVENATELRAAAGRVRESLEAYGGPFRGGGPPGTASVLGSIDAATLAQIGADDEVMGRARTRQFSLEIYVAELSQLRSMAERVLALVDQNLPE